MWGSKRPIWLEPKKCEGIHFRLSQQSKIWFPSVFESLNFCPWIAKRQWGLKFLEPSKEEQIKLIFIIWVASTINPEIMPSENENKLFQSASTWFKHSLWKRKRQQSQQLHTNGNVCWESNVNCLPLVMNTFIWTCHTRSV